MSLHAYKSIILAVKTGQPHNWFVVYRKKQSLHKIVSTVYKKSSHQGELWRSGRDSNSRPHAWQACILTDWTTGPRFLRTLFFCVCECKDTTFFYSDKIFLRKKCIFLLIYWLPILIFCIFLMLYHSKCLQNYIFIPLKTKNWTLFSRFLYAVFVYSWNKVT